jgi:hypothetical protein
LLTPRRPILTALMAHVATRWIFGRPIASVQHIHHTPAPSQATIAAPEQTVATERTEFSAFVTGQVAISTLIEWAIEVITVLVLRIKSTPPRK